MDPELDRLFVALALVPEFEKRFGALTRRVIDYVVDAPNTGRTSLSEASKPEKTIVGTKLQTYAQLEFDWPDGTTLDCTVAGIEFDVKGTIGSNWMIPEEAVDGLCLLVRVDDAAHRFHVGLLHTSLDHLNPGMNKDRKRSVNAMGRAATRRLVQDGLIPG